MKRKEILVLFSLIILIIGFVTPASAYIIHPNRANGWTGSYFGNLSFANIETYIGIMPTEWERSITFAANTWETETGLTHHWIRNHDSGSFEVVNSSIQFAQVNINGPAIAQTSTYTKRDPIYFEDGTWIINENAPPEITSAIIDFNMNFPWTTNRVVALLGPIDVESIALHELGHAMGLRDMYTTFENGTFERDSDTPSVMNSYSGVRRELFQDDIDAMREIYGFNTTETPLPPGPSAPRPNETRTVTSRVSDAVNSIFNKYFPQASAKEDAYIAKEDAYITDVLVFRTLVTELRDEEMASLIIKGVVKENTEPQWETRNGQVPTEQEIENGVPLLIGYNTIVEVEKVYKGELPENSNEIKIKRLGGTIDRTTVKLDTDVAYQVGDEVILYLVGDENQYYEMNNRGKIFINTNEKSSSEMDINYMSIMGTNENKNAAVNAWGEIVDLKQLEETLNSLENI